MSVPTADGAGSASGSGFQRTDWQDKEEVPTWDGSQVTWRAYLRRVELWQESTSTLPAKMGAKLASRLRSVAFDATEGLVMADLKKDTGVTYLLDLLRSRLQVSELHLQGAVLEEFFMTLQRAPGEQVLPWVSRFRGTLSRLKALAIDLPDPVLAWLLIRKSNLSSDQRHSVLSVGGGKWEMEATSKALITVLSSGTERASSSVARRSTTPNPRTKPWRPVRRHFPKRAYMADDQEELPEEEPPEEGEDQEQDQEELAESEVLSEGTESAEEHDLYLAYKEARDRIRASRVN